MQRIRAIFSKSVSLAAEWRVLVSMALAMSKHLHVHGRARPREALRSAEMLDDWIVCALTQVSHQITASGEARETRKPFDQQLAPIAIILQTIRVITQRLISGLRAACADARPDRCPPRDVCAIDMWATSPSFLDSS